MSLKAFPVTTAVPFESVRITSEFWTDRLQVCRTNTLPAIYSQMKKTGRWDSLKLQWKPGMPDKPHRFWDSDVAKWLEAACYALVQSPDSSLSRLVEEAVDLIRGAQHEDGYINTYFTVVEPNKRWTNIAWSHELYCAGHLLEAALAHYIYTGSYRLVNPILKYIKYISSIFGPESSKKRGYPGHEELELALIKGYEVIGDASLLRLAQYFVEERGKVRAEGHYFDIEAKARGEPPNSGPGYGPPYSYHQADKPIHEQISVEGHSVRAMYWLTGAAGVSRHCNDQALFVAVQRLWESAVRRKMYVTGGLGAMPNWEGFGPDYFLPNETGYLETCAALGLIFLSHQMTLLQPRVMEYANVLETAMYNAALVGISLDGRSFFYDNPLATIGKHLSRKQWFEVSCCPPNVARFLNSIGKYIYSVGGDNTIYVYQYISSTTSVRFNSGHHVNIDLRSDMPWSGGAIVSVEVSDPRTGFQICLRIPPGSVGFSVLSDSNTTQIIHSDNIIVRFSPSPALLDSAVTDSNKFTIKVFFSVKPRIVFPHELNLDNRGCIAIARGPIIYCAETIDNEHIQDLRSIRVPEDAVFEEILDRQKFSQWGLDTVILKTLVFNCTEEGSSTNMGLVPLTLTPYFMWANRGKSDLRVWLPRA